MVWAGYQFSVKRARGFPVPLLPQSPYPIGHSFQSVLLKKLLSCLFSYFHCPWSMPKSGSYHLMLAPFKAPGWSSHRQSFSFSNPHSCLCWAKHGTALLRNLGGWWNLNPWTYPSPPHALAIIHLSPTLLPHSIPDTPEPSHLQAIAHDVPSAWDVLSAPNFASASLCSDLYVSTNEIMLSFICLFLFHQPGNPLRYEPSANLSKHLLSDTWMDAWIDASVDGWMGGWMDRQADRYTWMNAWTDGRKDGWMHG